MAGSSKAKLVPPEPPKKKPAAKAPATAKKATKAKAPVVAAPEVKPFRGTRTLGGLIFPSKEAQGSIRAWVIAGAPDNVYVHDTLDNLVMAGIPIVDAKEVRGVYVRNHKTKPQKCEVDTTTVSPMHKPKVKATFDGILVSDPSHKQSQRSMVY